MSKNKCGIRQLSFTDNNNISLGMLNNRVFMKGPIKICERQPLKHFTWSILEYFVPKVEFIWMRIIAGGLVNNFCFSMNAWRDETCMDARNTEKEESAMVERVKRN